MSCRFPRLVLGCLCRRLGRQCPKFIGKGADVVDQEFSWCLHFWPISLIILFLFQSDSVQGVRIGVYQLGQAGLLGFGFWFWYTRAARPWSNSVTFPLLKWDIITARTPERCLRDSVNLYRWSLRKCVLLSALAVTPPQRWFKMSVRQKCFST